MLLGRERSDDDGESTRRHDRCTNPLCYAKDDECCNILGEAAGQRRDTEEHKPGKVHLALSQQVPKASHPHRQHPNHEHVARNRPGHRFQRRVKVPTNSREGHIDDKQVNVEHGQTETCSE